MSKFPIKAHWRTAIGGFGRFLRDKTSTDLGEVAARGALQQSGAPPECVDHVIFGNTLQTSQDTLSLARNVGLRIGLPDSVPAVTINRMCGLGLDAAIQAVHQIMAGSSKVVLIGAADSTSQAPFIIRGMRFGEHLSEAIKCTDLLWENAEDHHINLRMEEKADKIAEKLNITREEADLYVCQSQARWKAANDSGYFREEIEPITLKTKRGTSVFEIDEPPCPTTLEELAKLVPSYNKKGVVTAGNASSVANAGAAVVIASEDAVERHALTPLARIMAWNVTGCNPSVMGIGPIDAIQNTVNKSGISLQRINEVFSTQVLVAKHKLNIENERLNVNDGAVAMGHPLAASTSRIIGHLVYELKRRRERDGIASACIGGGQGIAMLFESV